MATGFAIVPSMLRLGSFLIQLYHPKAQTLNPESGTSIPILLQLHLSAGSLQWVGNETGLLLSSCHALSVPNCVVSVETILVTAKQDLS